MKRKKEVHEVLFDIKKEMPYFKKEELLEYAKWSIQKLYDSVKNKETQKMKIKCKKELIDKLLEQNLKYRITNEIDHISVQYVELFDCIKNNDEIYIKIYASVYFYDNTRNNQYNIRNSKEKYWNDIWIVTYRENATESEKNSNCDNCGAVMKYNKIKDMFECEYCKNTIWNKLRTNWEIIDIELQEI